LFPANSASVFKTRGSFVGNSCHLGDEVQPSHHLVGGDVCEYLHSKPTNPFWSPNVGGPELGAPRVEARDGVITARNCELCADWQGEAPGGTCEMSPWVGPFSTTRCITEVTGKQTGKTNSQWSQINKRPWRWVAQARLCSDPAEVLRPSLTQQQAIRSAVWLPGRWAHWPGLSAGGEGNR